MRTGVLAIRRDGTVAVINESAYRTLGLTPNPDHLGQSYIEVLGVDHKFTHVLSSAFDLACLPSRSEVRLGKPGKVLGYTVSRMVDAEGAITGAVLYFKDLTRVEQLEERERLRDRLAALGEMAAAIAHEVKNPLAGIQVMAGLLKRGSSISDDDQAILSDIIGEAQLANKIVVDLLEFVRPINLQIEPVSVTDILRDTVAKYHETAVQQDIDVDLTIPEDKLSVTGDHTQLRQLFTNLLINAFEALEGSGRVWVSGRLQSSEGGPQPLPAEAGDAVIVEVADDGPGIPPEVTDKIFGPFFTTKPRGSGLGLAIVRKIVDAHDGRIDVKQRPRGGTRFLVTLPVTAPPFPDTDEALSGAYATR